MCGKQRTYKQRFWKCGIPRQSAVRLLSSNKELRTIPCCCEEMSQVPYRTERFACAEAKNSDILVCARRVVLCRLRAGEVLLSFSRRVQSS